MKIEVVDFYPLVKPSKDLIGTLHVYVIDLDMDIRGIQVIKKKNGFVFYMPKKCDIQEEKKFWYPILSFTDNAKNIALNAEIRRKGSEFMKKR